MTAKYIIYFWYFTLANSLCRDDDFYRCVGNYHLQLCIGLDKTLYDSESFGNKGTGSVCYPGYSSKMIDKVFQPEPSCSSMGNFPLVVDDRIDLYYRCIGFQDEFKFFVKQCEIDHFFNASTELCEPIVKKLSENNELISNDEDWFPLSLNFWKS